MTQVCRAPPKHHNCATFTSKIRNNTARPHNTRTTTRNTPAYMRARARPISRVRALPTNRHEGGSLT